MKIIDQLQMASLYHHIRLERKMISGKEPKKEDYLKQASPLEFIRKLRINIIAFHSRAINDIIINGSFSHRLLLMNVLLAEGDLAFVDQYLQQ